MGLSNGFAPMHAAHPMHAASHGHGHGHSAMGTPHHGGGNPMMMGSHSHGHPMDHPAGPMGHPGPVSGQMSMSHMNGGPPHSMNPHRQTSHHSYGDLPPSHPMGGQLNNNPMDQMTQMRSGATAAGGPGPASGSGMDAGTNMFNDYSQSRGMPPGMTTGSEAPPFPGMGRPSNEPMNAMDLSQAEGQSNMNIPKVFSLSDLTVELGAQLAADGDVSLSLLAGNESSGLGIFPKNMSLGDIAQLEAPLDMN